MLSLICVIGPTIARKKSEHMAIGAPVALIHPNLAKLNSKFRVPGAAGKRPVHPFETGIRLQLS